MRESRRGREKIPYEEYKIFKRYGEDGREKSFSPYLPVVLNSNISPE